MSAMGRLRTSVPAGEGEARRTEGELAQLQKFPVPPQQDTPDTPTPAGGDGDGSPIEIRLNIELDDEEPEPESAGVSWWPVLVGLILGFSIG